MQIKQGTGGIRVVIGIFSANSIVGNQLLCLNLSAERD